MGPNSQPGIIRTKKNNHLEWYGSQKEIAPKEKFNISQIPYDPLLPFNSIRNPMGHLMNLRNWVEENGEMGEVKDRLPES